MVLEPNFVFDIKQLSLHGKEVSYVHNTDPPVVLLAHRSGFYGFT